jgi:hypothetical protein
MTHDDEDELAGIDVHAWRVPPPATLDRSALLVRALAPATAPARRPRLRWLVAGSMLLNAALAALIVIVLARPHETRTVVTVQPAGDTSVEARVAELLQNLARDQQELERKVREIQDLRDLVTQLSEKAKQCEARDRTTAKKPPPGPVVVEPLPPAPEPPVAEPMVVNPTESCDEVSCVLSNNTPACCAKYKKTAVVKQPPQPPESLDREAISAGVASVKAKLATCASTAKGLVKVHVRVDPKGLVTNVEVVQTPDAKLGACVAGVMARAVFPQTKLGGSFSYPFVF